MKCFGKDNPIRRNNNTLQINLFLFTTETQGMQVRHKLTTDVLILKSCHRSECGSPVSEAVFLGAGEIPHSEGVLGRGKSCYYFCMVLIHHRLCRFSWIDIYTFDY